MENLNVDTKIENEIQHMVKNVIIKDRRFLDNEQLIRSEQYELLSEIFNANVRDEEIRELSGHFAPILRDDHPMHLALWGKTGTGKTLSMSFFLGILKRLCLKKGVEMWYEHLDITTPRPCFRALNDLACLLNASKRYKKGVCLDEFMLRIEDKLANYRGYLILFIDEIDNVRRDRNTFMAFLIRRLPQAIPAKVILVFASNNLDWMSSLDPRVQSFLKISELVFKPYDAIDLKRILQIRVEKALHPGVVEPGVIEKIAALSSREHGDARKAVALLARGAQLAEKADSKVTLALVDQAAQQIEKDRYVTMISTAPLQLQATMAAVILAVRERDGRPVVTGEAYDAYTSFCQRAGIRSIPPRAFGDLIAELDLYSFVRSPVRSMGRYGRTRQIYLRLSEDLTSQIHDVILMNFELQGQTKAEGDCSKSS